MTEGMAVMVLQTVIHWTYIAMSGAIALLLLSRLFGRRTRTGLAYDIVYAYTIIPFLLRALRIK